MRESSREPAVSLSVRVPRQTRDLLESLAKATGRTKSFLTAEALQRFLEMEAWQVKAIREAVEAADRGTARWASHDEVKRWLESWGGPEEREPPRCR